MDDNVTPLQALMNDLEELMDDIYDEFNAEQIVLLSRARDALFDVQVIANKT